MKKGQLFEQPFVTIFAIVVIGLIFIFGFYVVRKFVDLSDMADLTILKTNIDKKVQECRNLDYGSICDFSKVVFSNVRVVCFIEAKSDFSLQRITSNFIKTNINRTDFVYNVYFEPVAGKRLKQNYFFISNLRPKENPTCQNVVGSKVNLVLENKGEFVEIRK